MSEYQTIVSKREIAVVISVHFTLTSTWGFVSLNLCIYILQGENVIDSSASSPVTLYTYLHCIHRNAGQVSLPIKVAMVTSVPMQIDLNFRYGPITMYLVCHHIIQYTLTGLICQII